MIAIIDYGAGNLRSVLSAFRRLNEPARITGEAAEIAAADGVILRAWAPSRMRWRRWGKAG